MFQHNLLIAVCCMLLMLPASAQKPNGAYISVAQDQQQKETTIKLFKDQHWMVAYPGSPSKPFHGVGGGTFAIKDGKYVEKLDFFSLDSTAVGNEHTFAYQLTSSHFYQEGKVNTARYPDYLVKENYQRLDAEEPLQNTSLEGTWELQQAVWGDSKFGEGNYKEVLGIKMYAYPRFAWVYYKPATRQVIAAGGGTYRFDGKKLLEKLEYHSGTTFESNVVEIDVDRHNKETYTQTSFNGQYKESWKRMK